MVFHRLEIRLKVTNVAEINRKRIRGIVKTLEGQSSLGSFVVPSPDGDSEAGRRETIILNFDLKSVKV